MHTILVHTPKGGAGRTVVSTALAAGFINLGQNVLVADTLGTFRRKRSCLSLLTGKLREQGFEETQIGHIYLPPEQDGIDALTSASEGGYDIAIIDTPRELGQFYLPLLPSADLLVCPATCEMSAAAAAQFIEESELWDLAVGLPTGFTRTSPSPVIRHAFGGVSLLKNELPSSQGITSVFLTGDPREHSSSQACARGTPGYAAYRHAQKIARHIQLLAAEVLWRLQGHELAPWAGEKDGSIANRAQMALRLAKASSAHDLFLDRQAVISAIHAEQ